MTVQSEQLNLDQGFGQANMQLNFVTRRGSNAFHGRIYDDFQNSALNANSWANDTSTALGSPAPKNLLHRNDFGASLGGRIIKDKLFFFGSYAELKIPGSYTTSNSILHCGSTGRKLHPQQSNCQSLYSGAELSTRCESYDARPQFRRVC